MEELTVKYLPNSDSPNKKERIQALQWQLRKNLETRNVHMRQSLMKLSDFKEQPSKVDILLSESEKRYRKIIRDNEEYLTNVGVATNLEEGNSMFLTLLQTEKIDAFDKSAQDAVKLLKQLMTKWCDSNVMKNQTNSKKMYDLLKDRETACENILQEKDDLILKLRDNIDQRRKVLHKDCSRRNDRISTLCKRVKNLVDNIEKAGKIEVATITKMFDEERDNMLKLGIKKMTGAFNEKHEDYRQENYDSLRKSIYIRYRNFLEHRVNCYNQLQPIRIGVSKELFNLQQQFRETQDELVDNLSKLKYSHHVLDLQIKECRFSRSETLRSKIRYFDCQLELKKRLKQYSSTDEVKRLENSIRKEQEKMETCGKLVEKEHNASKKSYIKLFNKKLEEAKSFLDKIFDADRFIVCNILNSQCWTPPDLSFLNVEIKHSSSEESRLRNLLQHFMEGTSEETKSYLESELSQSIVIIRPLDIELMINFIFETLNFLVSPEAKEFATKQFPESNDFVISNSFFPAIGIDSLDHLKMFIAHILNRACKDVDYKSYDSILINFRNVLDGFEDWRIFYNSNMQSSTLPTVEHIYHNEQIETWNKCLKVFPKEKDFVWDEVYNILKKHLSHLGQRIKLKEKNNCLRNDLINLVKIMGSEKVRSSMKYHHIYKLKSCDPIIFPDMNTVGTPNPEESFQYIRKYLENWIERHNL